VAQVVAALLLTLGGGVTLTSLGNLLGFGAIDLGLLSVPFTVFAMVGVINAVNMIDGIDGLAGGLILIALGALLFLAPQIGPIQILLLATIAALIPYVVCNLELFGVTGRKIFLGDAGSLLLGYILVWALVDTWGWVRGRVDRVWFPCLRGPTRSVGATLPRGAWERVSGRAWERVSGGASERSAGASWGEPRSELEGESPGASWR
jgi:hypothetical protein